MNRLEALKRLFASPEYQAMLKKHREDMQRSHKELLSYFHPKHDKS